MSKFSRLELLVPLRNVWNIGPNMLHRLRQLAGDRIVPPWSMTRSKPPRATTIRLADIRYKRSHAWNRVRFSLKYSP